MILNNGDKHLLFFFFLVLAELGVRCCAGFSPVVASGGYSSCEAQAIVVAFLVAGMGSRVCGLQ